MRGKLIVIDGNDGSGKATQAELLEEALVSLKKKVMQISFPRYEETFFGRELRKALDGQYGDFGSLDPRLASLLYTLDRWASKDVIHNALRAGRYVICDRYVSANQIHQGGKIKSIAKRKEFLAWLDNLEFHELGIPRPTVSIYLDVPPALSKELMSKKTRDIVENNPEYLENSHKSAQWLIRQDPERWLHVKCSRRSLMRSREEIHTEIITGLKARSLV